MPEVRMIDAEMVKLRIGELCLNNIDLISTTAFDRIMGVIDCCETISPELQHGRWIPTKLKGYYECSACRYEHTSNPAQRFCSYCGARMDGGE